MAKLKKQIIFRVIWIVLIFLVALSMIVALIAPMFIR